MTKFQGDYCPLIRKRCIAHECVFYTRVSGKHPQTEETIDKYGCAIAWQPILTIEATQVTRQNSATMTEIRNEFKKDHLVTQSLIERLAHVSSILANIFQQVLTEARSGKLIPDNRDEGETQQ